MTSIDESDSDEVYATDRSLPNSVSLIMSDDDTSEEENFIHQNKAHGDILSTPDEKLRKCERKLESYKKKGLKDQAFSQLIKLVPLRRLVFGDHHWKYAEAHSALARGYLDYKNYLTQAITKAEKAKSIFSACGSPASNQKIPFTRCLVEINLVLGRSLSSGKKYKEAESALIKSWQVFKSLEKQVSSVQIPTANSSSSLLDLKHGIKYALAELYINTKDTEKAISALKYLIEEISKHTSDKDDRLILIYTKLIQAENTRKKSSVNHELIIEYAIKAHDISTSLHSLLSVEVADTAFALGKAYADIDSEKARSTAEIYCKEALSSYQSCYRNNHKKTLRTQDLLNKLWMRDGKEDDVMKSLKSSIPRKREVFGECSSEVAESNKLVAGIYLTKGDLTRAHKYLKEAYAIEQEFYGPQHAKTKATKAMIAQLEDNPGFKNTKVALGNQPKFTSTIKSAR